MRRHYISCTAVLATMVLTPGKAAARLNVPVATRIVSFVQPQPQRQIDAAIIVDPANRDSERDAAAIEEAIGSGLTVGQATLRVRRVRTDALAKLSGAQVAFVTAGLQGSYPQIAAATARQSILTISADPDCVKDARCVVGISSTPRVQITINRAAARAAKIRFASAFLMLVQEID